MVGKKCAGILVDRIRRVTGGLIDDEQGSFRGGRGCVDQIFTLKQIGEKTREKKCRVYVVFTDLEKAYDRVNREALRMYDVAGKLLDGIKFMPVNSLACVRVKWGKSERFRIDSGVRHCCIISPWLFNVYIDTVTKEGSEIPGESGDYLTSCLQMAWFCVVSRRRS